MLNNPIAINKCFPWIEIKSILNVEQPSRTRRNVMVFKKDIEKGRHKDYIYLVRLNKYVQCNMYIETLEVGIHKV